MLGDDVPHGKQTDFYRAVAAREDETVVFSWVEWPSKAVRDDAMGKMMQDPRMDPANPLHQTMPFDGARMIFGGFTTVLELRAETGHRVTQVAGAQGPIATSQARQMMKSPPAGGLFAGRYLMVALHGDVQPGRQKGLSPRMVALCITRRAGR